MCVKSLAMLFKTIDTCISTHITYECRVLPNLKIVEAILWFQYLIFCNCAGKERLVLTSRWNTFVIVLIASSHKSHLRTQTESFAIKLWGNLVQIRLQILKFFKIFKIWIWTLPYPPPPPFPSSTLPLKPAHLHETISSNISTVQTQQ